MKEGPSGETLPASIPGATKGGPLIMLHAGLDLSRHRLDVCLLSDDGEIVDEFKSPPDLDGLAGLVRRVERRREPVRAVIESMTGARFVHDTLDGLGWE